MFNKATIQGRFVRDPELRHTQAGKSVCSFTIAWSTKNGDNEKKLYLNCTAWNRTADNVAKWFKKGQEAVVSGQLETQAWEDKQGNKRYNIIMVANEIHFCGPKTTYDDDSIPYENSADGDQFTEIDENSELPF